MSSSSSSTIDPTTRVPLLGSVAGGLPYAQWRPQMQTHLMRQGIETRDYAKDIPRWAALVVAVETEAESEEQAAIALLLAPPQGTSASSPSTVVKLDKDAQEAADAAAAKQVAAKKHLAALIARSKKAFAILYSSLPAELRPLIADVPQGYAFGIWSFLEKKYRNTEQDSVAALWADLTALAQDSEENFDTYKARVDSVAELLKHAKQSVPSGLYTSLVMWKLRGSYATAVLTLKTGGKLTDTDKINWPEIVTYMNQYERTQDGLSDTSSERAMAVRTGGRPSSNAWQQRSPQVPSSSSSSSSSSQPQQRGRSPSPHQGKPPLEQIQCFNCQKMGHYANKCRGKRRPRDEQHPSPKPSSNSSSWNTIRRNQSSNGSSSEEESDKSRTPKKSSERAHMVRTANSFNTLDGHEDAVQQSKPVERSSPPIQRTEYAGDHAFARSFAALALAATTPMSKKASSASSSKSSSAPAAATAASSKQKAKPLDELLKTNGQAIDTAATVSTSCNRESLHNVRRCQTMPIRMADGTVLDAMYKGDLCIRLPISGKPDQLAKIEIKDVYFHERFDANLLSWGNMRKNGWEMHSSRTGTYLITPRGSRVDASTRGNLTILEDTASARVYGARGARGFVCLTAKELLQLHRRLGHVSWSRLTEMCRVGATIGIGDISRMPAAELEKAEHFVKRCSACAEAKAHRKVLGDHGLDKGTRAGEVLHMDTFHGIARNLISGQKETRWCLVAVDGFTEWRWSDTKMSPKELPQAVKDFVQHSHTITGRYPRLLICDLGSEFHNNEIKTFCKRIGTQYQPTPARAKELNGLAEKNVGTMKNHAEAMMMAAKMSHSFGWAHAVNHFVYVWNRTHVGQHTRVTPYQSMTGRESSALNLGEFGCDVFVHQHRSQRDTTFSPKAEPGIYLGHNGQQNCPTVYLIRPRKIVLSKDVHFREGSFAHLRAHTEGHVDDIEPVDLSAMDPEFDADDLDSESDDFAPPVEEIEDAREKKFDLKSITDARTENGVKLYKCKWVGYRDASWEPATTIEQDAPTAVRDYETFIASRAAVAQSRPATRSATAPKAVSFNTAVSSAAASSSSSSSPSSSSSSPPSEDDDDSESEPSLAAAYAARCL